MVEVPHPTPDQQAWLDGISLTRNSVDLSVVIGGPKPTSNPMTADTTPSIDVALGLRALFTSELQDCELMQEARVRLAALLARAEAAEANARRLSEALATLQEQAQPLPKSYQWTGVKAAEDLFDMEVRHRNGTKPVDYLRGWLGMFRPFAFATKDDSWGELEKLISITMRNYVQLLAAVAALTTKEADRGPE